MPGAHSRPKLVFPRMNMLLFTLDDWGQPLAPTDYRAIHIRKQLDLHEGDPVRVGLLDRGSGTARLLDEPGEELPLNLDFPRRIKPALHFRMFILLLATPALRFSGGW